MKTTHTYELKAKATDKGVETKVTFESGTMEEWMRRVGAERTLALLHNWAAAHAGQGALKTAMKVLADAKAKETTKDAARRLMAAVKEGKTIDLIGLLPKERKADDDGHAKGVKARLGRMSMEDRVAYFVKCGLPEAMAQASAAAFVAEEVEEEESSLGEEE